MQLTWGANRNVVVPDVHHLVRAKQAACCFPAGKVAVDKANVVTYNEKSSVLDRRVDVDVNRYDSVAVLRNA